MKFFFTQKLQSKISEENVKYSKYALNVWKKNCSSLTGLKRLAYKYIKERWKRHTFRYADYKQFYKNLKMVSLSYTDEDPAVEVVMKENILEVVCFCKICLNNCLKFELFSGQFSKVHLANFGMRFYIKSIYFT